MEWKLLKSISDLPTLSVFRFFLVLLLITDNVKQKIQTPIHITTKFSVHNYGYLKLESSKRGGNRKVPMVYKPHQPKLGHHLPELFSTFLVEGQSCWLHSSTGKKETNNNYRELENTPKYCYVKAKYTQKFQTVLYHLFCNIFIPKHSYFSSSKAAISQPVHPEGNKNKQTINEHFAKERTK